MKCMILAFDGLEYNFVEIFDLENLKQREYGKVQLPKECFKEVNLGYTNEMHKEPWTPLVWFSFLTGKLPKEDNFVVKKWDNKLLNVLRTLSVKIGLSRSMRSGIGKILTSLGFSLRIFDRDDYKVPTIFDLTEKFHATNVPVFSRGWTFEFEKIPDDFDNFEDFLNSALTTELRKFNELRDQTLSFLERNIDWNLAMVYFKTLDSFGEVCFENTEKIRDIYSKVDKFVKEVKCKLNDKCFVLIISDHGMERLGKHSFGKHSNYAFYSMNRKLGLKNPKITDFYLLIKNVLEDNLTQASKPSKTTEKEVENRRSIKRKAKRHQKWKKEDEDRMRERLKQLGYI